MRCGFGIRHALGRISSRRTTAVAAVALAACFWPVEKLVVSAIVPDTFTPVPLFDLINQLSTHH